MRCPKCGYISFDQVEICGSCKKNVAKLSQELNGVTFKATVPDFLRFGVEPEPELEPEKEIEVKIEEEEKDSEYIEGEEEEIDFEAVNTEEDALEFAEEDTEVAIDLDKPGVKEVQESKEIDFDLDLDMGVADDPAAEEIQVEEELELGSEIEFDLSLEGPEESIPAPAATKI